MEALVTDQSPIASPSTWDAPTPDIEPSCYRYAPGQTPADDPSPCHRTDVHTHGFSGFILVGDPYFAPLVDTAIGAKS